MTLDFVLHDAVLLAIQASLVGLVGAGIPRWLRRYATARWALVLPLSIAVVVGAIALLPDVADVLTWVALILVPPVAALALGWAMRGARPPLALLAAPLLALAWASQTSAAGELAGAVLAALSCVTLGRLLAGAAPGPWLKAGIVAMAVVDAVLVFSQNLQQPNAVLNAAVPAPGLPQLQYLDLHYASMGYGDVFVAGVLGGVLATEGRKQWPVAILVFVLAALWDLLFLLDSINTLPATVPIAAALILVEVRPWLTRRRPGISSVS